jgi:hypothetical protein
MPADPAVFSFDILGRRFVARHATRDLERWLRAFWEHSECDVPPHPYSIALEVIRAAPDALPPDWKACAVPVQGQTLGFRTAGAAWEMREAGGGIRFHLLAGETRIRLWGIEAAANPEPLYLALYVALTEALRASGLLPLHAAVAARGETGVAWLGAGGAGKSTTLLHAARTGWRPVAEDFCWLEPRNLRLYGWDRGVRVRPDMIERFFPDLGDAPADPDGKHLVPYERLGAGEPRWCVLSRLALLTRELGGSASRWERTTAAEAVKALWESSGLPLHEPSRQLAATAIARLTREVPVARMVIGDGVPPLEGGARAWAAGYAGGG